MSAMEFNRSAPLGAGAAFGVVSFVEGVLDAFRAWRSAQATSAELSALTDSQLEDIGLTRGAIPGIARRLAAR